MSDYDHKPLASDGEAVAAGIPAGPQATEPRPAWSCEQ